MIRLRSHDCLLTKSAADVAQQRLQVHACRTGLNAAAVAQSATLTSVDHPALQSPVLVCPPAEERDRYDATTMHSYNLFLPPSFRSKHPTKHPRARYDTSNIRWGTRFVPMTYSLALGLASQALSPARAAFNTSSIPLSTLSRSPRSGWVTVMPMWPTRKYSVAMALCRPPATTMSFLLD